MAAQHMPLPQPNFENISEKFHALSTQFALCGNLPAIDKGARLESSTGAMLAELKTLITRQFEAVEKRFDSVEKRLDTV